MRGFLSAEYILKACPKTKGEQSFMANPFTHSLSCMQKVHPNREAWFSLTFCFLGDTSKQRGPRVYPQWKKTTTNLHAKL